MAWVPLVRVWVYVHVEYKVVSDTYYKNIVKESLLNVANQYNKYKKCNVRTGIKLLQRELFFKDLPHLYPLL